MHSAEMKPREPRTNIPATHPKISVDNPKTQTKINTVKEMSYRSPIHPLLKLITLGKYIYQIQNQMKK